MVKWLYNAFLSNQFENNNNVLAHYETTGKEIIEKLGKNIGGFVSGIGTGGTLMGVAKKLKQLDSEPVGCVYLYKVETQISVYDSQDARRWRKCPFLPR